MTLSPPGPPPVEPAKRASPRLRWASLPTRARLVVLVLAIDLLAAVVSFSLIVVNARSAVQVEMQATLANIELVVADTIGLAQSASPASLLRTLELRVQDLRHVRVAVFDAEGGKVALANPRARRESHLAPHWFAALIAPTPQRDELPIVAQGQRIGTALITTEPLDEIDEVWGYTVSLSLASLCLNLGLLGALYIAFGRVLAPLTQLADGLTQLERHDYTVRLDPPASRELAIIAERFNSVAEALSEARAANGRLNRQLLTAQDDERRRTALELHDEFGPCLFALEANAASVTRMAQAESQPDRAKLTARADEISAIVGQVQGLNRDLLNRLRPHALGQVPLAECLQLLLRNFRSRHSETVFEGRFTDLARGYGDLVDLTVFRCIQESMTNAVRHGEARHVTAEVSESHASDALRVEIRDDGTGLAEKRTSDLDGGFRGGIGLSGMRERVEALSGTFHLDNAAPGTVVRIVIPLDPERTEDTSPIVSV
ncbi:HAMP domain-containing protein [Methylobacterium sp. SD274]|uniref:ATP-binding protein n=1 Tax=Methylobacterium sp. SD274 TaxID=2782009 RepID=UPI001A96FFE6|nr:ATP-binding protein [Methylobacterium sp. SD274]MBO1020256.1 HAMP domain-containing protein [Methylobacterium sp. SD274]